MDDHAPNDGAWADGQGGSAILTVPLDRQKSEGDYFTAASATLKPLERGTCVVSGLDAAMALADKVMGKSRHSRSLRRGVFTLSRRPLTSCCATSKFAEVAPVTRYSGFASAAYASGSLACLRKIERQ
jgi:hypothetical protein